jgi:protein required for attachment to host cells
MSTEMIVAANAARARLFRRGAVGEPLVEVVALVHPQSRQVGHDLAGDRMGHGEADRRGGGGTAYEPKTDVRRKEHEHFAREVAQRLKGGLHAGEFERWVLFASSPFLGEIKAVLDAELQRSLHAAIDLDLTSYGLSEVDERASAALRARP